eukprot:CAMPEP_0194707364 /NCGR_PEP_ID=MMETSP0295-20121207/30106_1 /TAXON_ID=39354 /ORGANISM="Heterosigma akashiwo, Strain CCMP2393" /LENGTH=82 /DNA_ID=CAMNT_0039603469 /DNA_START=59 /DNA_END=307 /DNA_ORIENTATION=-
MAGWDDEQSAETFSLLHEEYYAQRCMHTTLEFKLVMSSCAFDASSQLYNSMRCVKHNKQIREELHRFGHCPLNLGLLECDRD